MGILVDETTRVIVQGVDTELGREVAGSMLDYGTPAVAGVARHPDRSALPGLPIYGSAEEAARYHHATATVIATTEGAVLDGVLSALSAGIRLLVVVTEDLAADDVKRMLGWAADSAARLVGPGSAGLVNPSGKLLLGRLGGGQPGQSFAAGKVAILARGGGSVDQVNAMVRLVNLGVSTAISLGDAEPPGTTAAALLPLCERDPETQGVVMVGQPSARFGQEIGQIVGEHRYTKPLIVVPPSSARVGGSGLLGEGAGPLRELGVLVVDELPELAQYLSLVFTGAPYIGPGTT